MQKEMQRAVSDLKVEITRTAQVAQTAVCSVLSTFGYLF